MLHPSLQFICYGKILYCIFKGVFIFMIKYNIIFFYLDLTIDYSNRKQVSFSLYNFTIKFFNN